MRKNLLVDWLTMSFKYKPEHQECFTRFLIKMLRIPADGIIEEKLNSFRIKDFLYSFNYRHVKMYVGRETLILECSGRGCRTLEFLNPEFHWFKFLHTFDYAIRHRLGKGLGYQVHISRLDVACDLIGDKTITMDRLFSHANKRSPRFVCKSRYFLPADGNMESWIMFGSAKSDRRLRIYDKGLEQRNSGELEVTESWIRFEMQLRNDNATSFYLNLCENGGNFGACYYGILRDYLRFTREENEKGHSQRLHTCDWWQEFLEDVSKISQLYLPGDSYDIHTLTRYLEKGCASSITTYLIANGGDVTELMGMVIVPRDKLNMKQRHLLQDLKDEALRLSQVPEEPLAERHKLPRPYYALLGKLGTEEQRRENLKRRLLLLGENRNIHDEFILAGILEKERLAAEDLEFPSMFDAPEWKQAAENSTAIQESLNIAPQAPFACVLHDEEWWPQQNRRT